MEKRRWLLLRRGRKINIEERRRISNNRIFENLKKKYINDYLNEKTIIRETVHKYAYTV
jgi:ribosomal protein L13E